ncbi:TonB-dependent receptor [Pelomonas sp. CA6]|uniref:TonB-dependent receptor domain-containing protein n=1 Tax=Pelomonas sp. CA6 TaxID=2907999 RepID=UPI001F4B1E5B|nr:TonB-dependent receptor [Pelomonas sp. CA6]MCH7342615.1 TonB-dependent receptor [Pelomonas sp. CA6]
MKLQRLAQALALVGLGAHLAASAQGTPAQPAPKVENKIERVEVTGSSIKRVSDEGALPLEVITGEQIQARGLNSAEDLLRSLAANTANANNAVSSNSVFGDEADRLSGGGAYANLRGLGPTGTLVLLNGRRLSNQGMSGGSVDLNAIPLDMVERVEVLKDGASAIYGTDAIGGVINFILKRDYQGAQVKVSYSTPEAHGGGQQRKLTLAGGWGDLGRDGFNIMGSITRSRNTILRGIDRPWATGYQPERGLVPDTSSAPMFANILNFANTALPAAGTTIGNGTTKYTVLNGLALTGQCGAAPFGVSQLGNIGLTGGYAAANATYRCGTDYGRQFMLGTPSNTTSGVLRASFNVGRDATGFVEFVGSRYYSLGEFTPYQFSASTSTTNSDPSAMYPVNGPYYPNMKALYGANDFDPTKPVAYRLRMWDWGYRTLGFTSTNQRLATGIEGAWGDYDYKVSLSRGQAKAYSEMVDGYADGRKLLALLASGKYNPFLMPGQTQSAEARQLIEDSKAHGRLHGGKTQVDEFNATLSGPLMKLPAGDLAFAVGTNLRREFYGFSGTKDYSCVSFFDAKSLALNNPVLGCPGNATAPDMWRKVGAIYGELLVPVTKGLEMQLALRHDRYQQIGSTTNPKVAFKFTPMKDLLIRGSANTGFRAPTPQQLNLGTVTLATTGTLVDPVKCPDPSQVGTNPACAMNSIPYLSGGNPNLKPEKSKQATLGVVFSPVKSLQASVDYWQVKMTDRIHNLTVSQQLANYPIFANNFIRDETGKIVLIQAGWINAGSSMTKGLDLSATHTGKLLGNTLTTTLTATKMISAKEQLIVGTPMKQYLGQWTNTTLYLPWRAALSTTYKLPKASATLSVNYSDGYMDEDHTSATSQVQFQKRKISSYTTVNLTASYTGFKDLTLSAGVINLADRQPPFTWHNVDNVAGSGWDPRVADPRGRTVQLSAQYSFF